MSDGLFDSVLARGPVAAAVADAAWLVGMLRAEAALAGAGGDVGLVPAAAADRIGQVCHSLIVDSAVDVASLGAAAASSGNPVVPLVRLIEHAAGQEAGPYVHRGATSQDVLDTAMVLVARQAVALVAADLRAAAERCDALAAEHRDTPIAGRTLLQQALPTTFGLKTAGWALGLDGAADRLDAVAASLPAQLGGAVGTLSAGGSRAPELVAAFARRLDLIEPLLPWHTLRLPVADLTGALATAAGVVGKVALDLVLLAQTEVGELSEQAPGRGGSSTMPHKSNPIAAICARAAARRAPGLAATLLAAMEQEHERAAGAWHAEWHPLSDLARVTGSAASWLLESLTTLRVDTARMRTNLEAAGPDLGAEAVAGALADALGRGPAHDLVAQAVRDPRGLRAAVLAATDALSAAALDDLLDPLRQAGCAGPLVDRALASRARSRQNVAGPVPEERSPA